MTNVLVDDSYLSDIADTIRSKLGVQDTYKPSEMAGAIDDIGGGVTPTGTKQISISANGTTTEDVAAYASAQITVAVPGASLGTKSITENGTYNASSDSLDGYSSVTVNVSGGGGGGASGSFTPESNTRTVSISLPSQPSGMFCCADYDGYPTDNTWKMFAFAYIDSTNGGFRVTRYGPSNYNIAARAANTFVYADGILTVTADYNFIAGVTYRWHAW